MRASDIVFGTIQKNPQLRVSCRRPRLYAPILKKLPLGYEPIDGKEASEGRFLFSPTSTVMSCSQTQKLKIVPLLKEKNVPTFGQVEALVVEFLEQEMLLEAFYQAESIACPPRCKKRHPGY